jgi:hypothetical protein
MFKLKVIFLNPKLSNILMKKVVLLLIFSLFLFGCIQTPPNNDIPKLQEEISYENIDLIDILNINPEAKDVIISPNKKSANILLNPDLKELSGFLNFSLNINSDSLLKFNSIISNETHNQINLHSIIINTYFEKRPSNIIFLGDVSTIEKDKIKQTITLENTEDIAKDINISLNFYINSSSIKLNNEEIKINKNDIIVFKTDNYDLDISYDEYYSSTNSFTYETNGKIHTFDWTDLIGKQYAILITTEDEKISHIEIQTKTHLNPKETVIFDPSYSSKNISSIEVKEFIGVSDIKDIKMGYKGSKEFVYIMTEDTIYYIEDINSFKTKSSITDIYTAKFTLPYSDPQMKFMDIDTGNVLGNSNDILITIFPYGAMLIPGNTITNERVLDIHNPGTSYSFASQVSSFNFFDGAYINEDEKLACFGSSTYFESGTQYTHNVFCFKHPFIGTTYSPLNPNVFKFNEPDLWYRTIQSGESGCA